jgi:excisionase family DNA binding protein
MEQDSKRENTNGKNAYVAINSKEKYSFFESLNSSSIKWLTTKETAEYLRTTPRQIRKWVYQGKIRAFKVCGRSLRFKRTDLDLLFKGGHVWE